MARRRARHTPVEPQRGERTRLGISACLLGEPVRHDGTDRRDAMLVDALDKHVQWVPVCPEVGCGLAVPREAMWLVGDAEAPRLTTTLTGIDHTERLLNWARKCIGELEAEGLCGFVFKSRSPSCGMRQVAVYDEKGNPCGVGLGLFAREFIKHFPLLPIEDEERLQDATLRERFIGRISRLDR